MMEMLASVLAVFEKQEVADSTFPLVTHRVPAPSRCMQSRKWPRPLEIRHGRLCRSAAAAAAAAAAAITRTAVH